MTVNTLLARRGTTVLIHRERDAVSCPCRTPEGYRDPEWHKANPLAVVCNDAGFLPDAIEVTTKAIVIPIWLGGRRSSESISMKAITVQFGEVQTDDHIGIFPIQSGAEVLNFDNWSPAGEDYIEYRGMRFIVIAWNLVPDPHDTSRLHHWEVGLRRINRDEFGIGGF